ncbi:MAG: substrate-binding domain-containing protein [Lawsonibacter sp.]|nr:substrate-binding domain-containing protein [Lawsonibacter sp.]
MAMKYKILADLLREELVKAGGAGERLPTEAELTRRYRMSRQTVRHALRLLAEEGLVQSRQGSGTYATGRTREAAPRQIAVVTSFLDDYIFPTILHDAQSTFTRHGCSTLVYATENRVSAERDILSQLLERPVGGILVEGSKTALPSPNADLYQRLRESGVPMLFLHGAYSELEGIPCVSDDNYGGGYLLASCLAERGHRHLAGIFKSDDVQGPQRYHGCISAIRDAGLPIHDRCFFWYDTEDRREMLEGRRPELLRRFLTERLGPATGIICYNDEIAFLLIQQLLEMGRRVPEDVSVVSFDNSYYSQISPIPITSLRHREKMGQAAAEELMRILEGEPGRSRALEWQLLERRSSG